MNNSEFEKWMDNLNLTDLLRFEEMIERRIEEGMRKLKVRGHNE